MPEKQPIASKGFSADWFLRGALTRIGDTFDKLTGRRWIPSSSLATSGLIERLKMLLESEARNIPGKGTVVPHNIKLKIQWDKFSTEADDAIAKLETELLTAAADYINDSLYYTFAPLKLEVKPDYFTEGVKLYVSFENFAEEDDEAELNVTVHNLNVAELAPATQAAVPVKGPELFVARFSMGGENFEKQLVLPAGGRLGVGRSGMSDLTIGDSSVSKIHASLALTDDGKLCVADTGSTNGTFLNDEHIAYGKAVEISEGDVVKFGLVEVRLTRIDSPSDSAALIEHPAEDRRAASPADQLNSQNDTVEVPHSATVSSGDAGPTSLEPSAQTSSAPRHGEDRSK